MKKTLIFIGLCALFMSTSCVHQAVVDERPDTFVNNPPSFSEPQINTMLVLEYKNRWNRIDLIEKMMVSGAWREPVAEEFWKISDTIGAVWKAIEPDSTGWFSGRNLRGTYVYFSVNSPSEQVVLLETMGNRMTYVNGEPRIGNPYQNTDTQEPWAPQYNYGKLPVILKKGTNHLFFNVNRGRLKVKFHPMNEIAKFNVNDPTLPDILIEEPVSHYGAVLVMNGTGEPLSGLKIESCHEKLKPTIVMIPAIPPMTARKVPFKIEGPALMVKGDLTVQLTLTSGDILLDQAEVKFNVKNPKETHKRTFFSQIDGSLQYYAVNPAQKDDGKEKALVLSVHGASVEAINQAGSYAGKDWAYIVSPTNRRPYGYDWEDWGRIDAIEVLAEAKKNYKIDDEKIYLTGHSMGGHGTWYLGVTYPDKWATIGPSAGWISYWTYVSHRMQSHTDELWKMMRRSSRPTDTYGLVDNIADKGIYIIHGADDDVVKADQAHQMIDTLKAHGINYKYHEEPGAGHWWDHSDEPGTDCVDWPELFDYFSKCIIPADEVVRDIQFTTANPAVSAWNKWLGIEAQDKQLELSKAKFRWNPGSRSFQGMTENVARLSFKLGHLSQDSVAFEIDGQIFSKVAYPAEKQVWFARDDGKWAQVAKPDCELKGPHRYGTLKDAYNHRFVFVYGTLGDDTEDQLNYNKARFDAETFWMQGNGAMDIVPDTEYVAEKYRDRSIILFGNASTNSAWEKLLAHSPVQLKNGSVKVGDKEIQSESLACFFVYPKPDSENNLVAVVGGTGKKGMKLTQLRDFMYPFTNSPDFVLFNETRFEMENSGIEATGFFGNDWSVEKGEFLWR
ncbi:MAG: prolyl oligopeptidase family serine peptidase [Candidatus Marinimicrobia bacterium]|nr:prolyl oligopeptidase family serine peptidase [Candidatus Neomarinimicrobiota bacterium]